MTVYPEVVDELAQKIGALTAQIAVQNAVIRQLQAANATLQSQVPKDDDPKPDEG